MASTALVTAREHGRDRSGGLLQATPNYAGHLQPRRGVLLALAEADDHMAQVPSTTCATRGALPNRAIDALSSIPAKRPGISD